jgi:hypothetical protein
MILPGSYANGFAPRDGQPLYPELWRGCVGAWAPCLGPTGLTLRDWSGFGNHGALTNMTAGSDWVQSQGRYALDFDGTDDYIDAGSGPSLDNLSEFTLSAWIYLSTSPAVIVRIIDKTNSSALAGWSFYVQSDRKLAAFVDYSTTDANAVTTGTLSTGQWYHVAAVHKGSTKQISLYVNGVEQSLSSSVAGVGTLVSDAANSVGIGDVIALVPARNFPGLIDDVWIYSRQINSKSIMLHASRRGIAYELAPRSWSAAQIAAYRSRYYSQLVGGGVI